ncbi:MAG: hypothetical protein LBT33_10685, partial [Spirochaetia bacterium]|nr:hypothetical protein [Spirochaetia bacterium]
CIVGTSDYRINTCGREFERREVIGIIDEHAVWLKKHGTREKLNIRYSHLIEGNGKNREIIKGLEAINEQNAPAIRDGFKRRPGFYAEYFWDGKQWFYFEEKKPAIPIAECREKEDDEC